jgi:antitoxin component of MazEF toxin-antitoxin module
MSQYINLLRQQGSSLVMTIPSDFVRELGLVRGDRAIIRREPDGLKLRIIRHSKLVELANAQEATEAAE